MATQDPKTDPQIEEKEEKESPSILSQPCPDDYTFLEFGSNFLRILRKFNQTN